jgi:hypothetical protein
MAENDDVAGSPGRDVNPSEQPPADEPTTVSPAVSTGSTTPAPVLKTRWRDRAWSFRALLAVALATLVIGGVGGLVIGVAAAHHGDRHDGFYRMGPGGGPGMPPGWRMHRGPGWRWDDGQGWQRDGGPQQPQLTPYGGSSPSTPSPSPGSTG